MIQRCLAIFAKARKDVVAGKVDSQYLVGSGSFCGHSITNHSSRCGSVLVSSRWAGRTRTAANRERKFLRLPGRQAMFFQAAEGNPNANCFTETG
jgi:hypothetical protein